MNDWQNFFNPLSQFVNQGNYRIFEPDSKDEILHWFSREDIPQQQKEDFIEALVNFDDGCGGFYGYRAYFLAAEALAYFPNSRFGDVIVEQLLNWAYVYFGWKIVPKPLRYAAREALKVTDKPRVIKAFTHLLHTTTSRLTLRQAAVELGLLDSGNKIAIAALLFLLELTETPYQRAIICDNLSQVAQGNENAVIALLQLLEQALEDESFYYNINFRWYREPDDFYPESNALKKIAFGNQTAIASLEHLLYKYENDDYDCFDLATTLLTIDSNNVVAEQTLLGIIEKTECGTLLDRLVEYCRFTFGLKNQAIISALSRRLNNQCSYINSRTAWWLGQLDSGNLAAIQTLIQLLKTTDDICFFQTIVRYLSQIGFENQEIIYILEKRLEECEEESNCLSITIKFLEFGHINDKTIGFILYIIENSLNKYNCQDAIISLGNINFDTYQNSGISNQTITALTKFLKTNWGDNICVDVAEFILIIEPTNQLAISYLTEALNNNRSYWIRWNALSFLLETPGNSQNHLNYLIDLISLANEYDSLRLIYEYLNNFTKSDTIPQNLVSEAVNAFLRFIQSIDETEYQQDLDAYHEFTYNANLLNLVCNWQFILQPEHLPQIVKSLTKYLDEKFYNSNSYRYEAVYNLIWHCAQNMTYQEFCQANE